MQTLGHKNGFMANDEIKGQKLMIGMINREPVLITCKCRSGMLKESNTINLTPKSLIY